MNKNAALTKKELEVRQTSDYNTSVAKYLDISNKHKYVTKNSVKLLVYGVINFCCHMFHLLA